MLEMRGAQVSTAATRPSAGYLPGLDGLRAISVTAVLLYHADLPWMPGGFLGVEVFFVISGYLITLLLTEEHARNSTISLRNFWTRRARRLLPALYTLLAVVSVIVLLFYREETFNLAAQVWSALAYVTNWYFIVSDQSYFATRRAAAGLPAPLVAGHRGAVLPRLAAAPARSAEAVRQPPHGDGARHLRRRHRLARVDGRAVRAGDGSQPRLLRHRHPGLRAC